MRWRATSAIEQLLLVLDNFEHVLDAAPLVARAAGRRAGADGARRPVASRFACAPSGCIRSIRWLCSRETDGDMSARAPAVALFVAVARARDPDFALSEGDGAQVVRRCAGGWTGCRSRSSSRPARLGLLSVAELAARLRHDLGGSGPRRATPPRGSAHSQPRSSGAIGCSHPRAGGAHRACGVRGRLHARSRRDRDGGAVGGARGARQQEPPDGLAARRWRRPLEDAGHGPRVRARPARAAAGRRRPSSAPLRVLPRTRRTIRAGPAALGCVRPGRGARPPSSTMRGRR